MSSCGHRPAGVRRAHRVSGHLSTVRRAGYGVVLSADPLETAVPYARMVVTETLRSLWTEPRAPDPPRPARRDWLLAAACAVTAVVETLARPDLVWRPLSLLVVIGVACTLPWRRTHPLAMVAVTFGTVSVVDAVAIAAGVDWEGLGSGIFLLLLPYSLVRWGSGREVAAGLAILAVPISMTAVDGAPTGDVVGGALIVLLAAALGAGARYQHASRRQEVAGVRSRERELLARELHDTVAHHVSAIAVQAQAGRALAGTQPGAAADVLTVIEEEASRTLEEMRSMVGALRDGDRAELRPQQGLDDIRGLARSDGHEPRVEVEVGGEISDLHPSVEAALYRLAQEAVTNAVRHARRASVVHVRVAAAGDHVRLTVDDDGEGAGGAARGAGFGLIGMAERVKLLGGTFEAGPRPDGGWTVASLLPSRGTPR
jgi:signal transduction histidine kinase